MYEGKRSLPNSPNREGRGCLQVRRWKPAQSTGMSQASYPFTPNEAANRLLAKSGTALLIGLCLEQQVRSEKAMLGPYELKKRLGHLDARKIAKMSPAKLASVFSQKPALHRFPRMMARRVRELCAHIVADYGQDGANVWHDVASADELFARLRALPGFGAGKAGSGVRILGKFGKRKLEGWSRHGDDQDLPWLFKNGKRVP